MYLPCSRSSLLMRPVNATGWKLIPRTTSMFLSANLKISPTWSSFMPFDDGRHQHDRRRMLQFAGVLYDLEFDVQQFPATRRHVDLVLETVKLQINGVQPGFRRFPEELQVLSELDAVGRCLDLGETQFLCLAMTSMNLG